MTKRLAWTLVAFLIGVSSTFVLGQTNGSGSGQAADALGGKLPDGSNYRVV